MPCPFYALSSVRSPQVRSPYAPSQNKLIIVLNTSPIICKNVQLRGSYLDPEVYTDYNDHRYYSNVQEVESWEECH